MAHHSFSRQDILDYNNDREVPAQLPINAINLLTQVRKSITDISELAESIRTQGQLTQGFAAALSPRQTSKYLRELNDIHGSAHVLKDLHAITLDGEKLFVVLVAGHRRYLAVSHLLKSNAKLTKKFKGHYRCVLHFGMSARAALEVQFQENRHQQVPLHEEAATAWGYYKWQKRQEPNLTLKKFGKSIGRSASWVKSAVRFCSLPDSLQRYASEDEVTVPYGILTEVARYADGMQSAGRTVDPTSLERMVIDTVTRRTTVAKFRSIVTSRLEHARGEQESLFESLPEQKRPVRRVVAPELIKGLWPFLAYLQQLEGLQAQGAFGEEDYLAPEDSKSALLNYSPGSPIHLTTEVVKQLENMLPHLVELASQNGGRHHKELQNGESVVAKAGELLADLDAQELQVVAAQ